MLRLKSKKEHTKEKKAPPQVPDPRTLQVAIADIASESWRFEQAMKKVLSRMDVMEAERFSRQYGYFATKVNRVAASVGIKVRDLAGQQYMEGLPVQVMNLEEFDEDDHLIITQMIEPVIMLDGQVIKTGVAMAGRV